MSKLERITFSAEETANLGYQLGQSLASGGLLCLSGDLGAGKTTLVQGIGRGWGISEPLTSPTFVIVHQHQRPDGQTLYHLDAYRLKSGVESIGLEDILAGNGLVIIEWAEQISEWLPDDALWIYLDYHETEENARYLTLEADETRLQQFQEAFYAAGN